MGTLLTLSLSLSELLLLGEGELAGLGEEEEDAAADAAGAVLPLLLSSATMQTQYSKPSTLTISPYGLMGLLIG